ncbi:hypothetical protein Tco_0466911, partial [Tanacetum coccineum]
QDSEDVFAKEGQHQMPKDEQEWQYELEMMVTQELVANAMNDESRQAFEEIKEEFDKFVPTKAKLKRYGEELQTKTSKKQRLDDKDVLAIGDKVAEVKEEEPVKRTGKRKKQKARKGDKC